MAITVTTAPTFEPISLAEAKLNLRVDGNDEDTLISRLISVARRYCEREGRMTIPRATLKMTLDAFPCGTVPLLIPNPPLVSVSSIAYVDTSGTAQTWAAENYKVVAAGMCEGRLAPAYGQIWPAARREIGAVEITYLAGYADAGSIPATTIQAMHLLIGHWYANREAIATGTITKTIELAVDALLWCERTKI